MNRCHRSHVVRGSLFEQGSRLLLVLPLLLFFAVANGQSRSDLEKKREALDKQIRTTTTLIEQARKEQRVTQEQLRLLESQIEARAQLIRAMDNEVRQVDDRITEDEAAIASLKDDLAELRKEYAHMVQFAYRNRSGYDQLSYLFASNGFQQAFRRSRYLNQLGAQRLRQVHLITGTQTSLAARVEELQQQRKAKASLLSDQVQEKRRLDTDLTGQQKALNSLRSEEGRLKETQRKQEKQRRELDAAIRKAIEDAVKVKPSASGAAKPGKLDISLTPEARELNTDFEKNKGKLPWPVEKGVITGRFGKQPHPVLKGIMIDNNGIDITTEKGASVRALFRGEVSGVIVLPGAGKAVIVSHGVYRTVYSNLRDVNVTKGQKLDTKQTLGTVNTDENGSVAHIEVWKITSDGLVNVDPTSWILH